MTLPTKLPARVLFVCIGNSCRSQMAEGFARHHHSDVIAALSAGIYPASIVQPETIAIMAEKSVSLEGQTPKTIQSIAPEQVDLLVNMSGRAVLGLFPGFEGGNLIWEVEDPIGQPMTVYQDVRDRIETLVGKLAAQLRPKPSETPE